MSTWTAMQIKGEEVNFNHNLIFFDRSASMAFHEFLYLGKKHRSYKDTLLLPQ